MSQPAPTEIDLDDLIKDLRRAASMYSAPGAAALLYRTIAAVEALRERVAEIEQSLDDPALPDSWYARAESAEAHAVELAEALFEAEYAISNAARIEGGKGFHSRPFDYEDFCCWAEHWITGARIALKATPPKALARSRAVQKVADQLWIILPLAKGYAAKNNVGNNMQFIADAEEALSALDALQGEPTP